MKLWRKFRWRWFCFWSFGEFCHKHGHKEFVPSWDGGGYECWRCLADGHWKARERFDKRVGKGNKLKEAARD